MKDKSQKAFEAVSNHFEGSESLIYIYESIAEDPRAYARRLVSGIHTDLLLLRDQEGMPIWEESIRDASLAARILEAWTGEKTPPKYAGKKWRSWDDE